ncbi:MAG: hypothetical protein KatS3mg124_2092 [Porticoccaceae bacterium]|nr:MAG: hypothetical protein KatS3mg124_2092 [Porticoccaceae bacterium]
MTPPARRRGEPQAGGAEEEKAGQQPAGNAQAEESPLHLGTVAVSLEEQRQPLRQGEILHQVVRGRAAGRHPFRREVLEPQLAGGEPRTGEGRQGNGGAVQGAAPVGPGRCSQAIRRHDAHGDHQDALDDAQVAGSRAPSLPGGRGPRPTGRRRPGRWSPKSRRSVMAILPKKPVANWRWRSIRARKTALSSAFPGDELGPGAAERHRPGAGVRRGGRAPLAGSPPRRSAPASGRAEPAPRRAGPSAPAARAPPSRRSRKRKSAPVAGRGTPPSAWPTGGRSRRRAECRRNGAKEGARGGGPPPTPGSASVAASIRRCRRTPRATASGRRPFRIGPLRKSAAIPPHLDGGIGARQVGVGQMVHGRCWA